MPRSKAEECFAVALDERALPGWDLIREFQFDKARKWKFDFCFPSQKLAMECDGLRHRTAGGAIADMEKCNEAVRQGWRVLHFPSSRANPTSARRWASFIIEVLCCPPSTARESSE